MTFFFFCKSAAIIYCVPFPYSIYESEFDRKHLVLSIGETGCTADRRAEKPLTGQWESRDEQQQEAAIIPEAGGRDVSKTQGSGAPGVSSGQRDSQGQRHCVSQTRREGDLDFFCLLSPTCAYQGPTQLKLSNQQPRKCRSHPQWSKAKQRKYEEWS